MRSSFLLLMLSCIAACSAPPTPTPEPMPDPDPVVTSFTAEKPTLTRGSRARLTAVFANGEATISPALGGAVTSGAVLETAPLDADTTFTLTVSAPDKTPATATVVVHVVPAAEITSFTSADSIVTAGTSTTLTAVFTGGTGTVTPGIGPVTSGTPFNSGNLSSATEFTLTVTNAAGDAVTRTLQVDAATEPRIVSFTAQKTTITRGTAAVLTAVFAGGMGVINGSSAVLSGDTFTTLPLMSDTTFTLVVTGPVGMPKTATIDIVVVDAPVILSFSAVQEDITAGQFAQLLANFSGGTGAVSGQGSIASNQLLDTLPLSSDTTFVLTVTNPAMDTATAMVTVHVHAAPNITSFTAARSIITTAQMTTLTAVFSGGTGVVDQGLGPVVSGMPIDTPQIFTQTRTFTLTVTNPAGSTATATVMVQSVASPVINTFTATPRHSTIGQSVVLSGSFGNGTATIDNGVGTVSGPSFFVTSPPIQAATQFRLTVTNAAGDSVFAVVDVTAVPPPVITSFTGVPVGSMDAGTTSVRLNVGQWISMTPVYSAGVGRIGPTPAPSGQLFNQTPTTDTTYTLSVSNDAGTTVTADVNALIDHDVYVASGQGYVAVYRSHLDMAGPPVRRIYIQNCPLPSGVALQPISAGGLVPAQLWVTCRAQGATAARIMRIQSPQAINNSAAMPATSSLTPISGAATLLNNPVSIAIDSLNGVPTVLIVAESGSPSPLARGRVLVFSASMGGNVAPLRMLDPPTSGDLTQLGLITQVALYASEIYVASRNISGLSATNGVLVFPLTWTGTNIAPTRWFIPTSTGTFVNGLAVNADGIYVSSPSGLTHFSLGVTGTPSALHVLNVGPGGQLAIFDRQLMFANVDMVWGHSTVDLRRLWGAQGPAFSLGVAGQIAVDPLR
ncbi:MAG: hypothetical protein JNM17_34165 [Archangium sp.]|nr:hypothetical protein [Archangium sp.]